ncbi:MAG: hypothetical protein KKA79_01835 [Nanoarchaeota archaeon]|nr:hypothetical protein [Nanoarchaeota archaeon]MCG2719032.1 hypothetical protein [Nanoarchaeota archaeon]
MTYLISIHDTNISATEAYILTEEDLPIDELARKAAKEYMKFCEQDEIGKGLEDLINDRLDHYHKCKGCQAPEKMHGFSLEPREGDEKKYGLDDNDYVPLVDVNIISLDYHPEFKQFCENLQILQPEKLVHNEEFDHTDEVEKLRCVMIYEEEF